MGNKGYAECWGGGGGGGKKGCGGGGGGGGGGGKQGVLQGLWKKRIAYFPLSSSQPLGNEALLSE